MITAFRRLLTAPLILILAIALTLPFTAFKCSPAERQATCNDVVTGLNEAKATGINIPARMLELGPAICTAVGANDLNAKNLIAEFLPLLDQVIAAHGKSPALALVDIAIHIVLNHLPLTKTPRRAGAASDPDDAILREYKARPVWGCEFRPDKCASHP